MKKTLSILLALVMILGLCACGSSNAKPEGLQAGYARQSMMPKGSVGLGGYSNADTRKSTGFIDYVYLTCTAFSEGEDTVLLFTADTLSLSQKNANALRNNVSTATGVPTTNIFVSCSHSHAAPAVGYDGAYDSMFIDIAVAAAKDALADLSPATMYGANVQVEGMNFIRHYIQADGTYSSGNIGNFKIEPGVKHAREADPELVLIKVQRDAEDKADILLANWAAHPCYDAGNDSTLIHADYIGTARTAFEKETGMHFAFFQGGGGDAITNSSIPERMHSMDRIQYGQALAKHMVDALPTMEKVEGEGIKLATYNLEYACHHFDEEKLSDAQRIMDLYTKDRTAAVALCSTLGFTCYNHVKGVVRAAGNPEKETMELNALSIGGVAFTTVPGEVFSQTSMYVKDNSPFKYTVFCSITNGYYRYIPISEAFDYPSYEAYISVFAKGAAEAFSDQLVTMLKDLQ